jgi:hypothetical protein
VVEEGLDYGSAKRRAAASCWRAARAQPCPTTTLVERAVRELSGAVSRRHPAGELVALRRLALQWMERLAEFRPHLSGAVWHGTATRLAPTFTCSCFAMTPNRRKLRSLTTAWSYQARPPPAFNGALGGRAQPVQLLPGTGRSRSACT